MNHRADWFPIDRWLTDIESAVDEVIQRGQATLEAHRANDKAAAQKADLWHLGERHEHARNHLLTMISAFREIIASIEECRHLVAERPADDQDVQASMVRCSDIIDRQLPGIEKSIVEIRHCALDLLQWTQRTGRTEETRFQSAYRKSFAGFVKYTPIFKPMMSAFQRDLLQINQSSGIHPNTQRLLSAITRYNSVMDSIRGFVASVVEPPLELMFHETEAFDVDIASMSPESIAAVATEVNDCCQLLLYDPVEFRQRVQSIRPTLAEGFDASMVVLTVDKKFSLFFTVDEDPLFKQLSVTLLRVVPIDQLEQATDELTNALYASFSPETQG